MEQFSTDVFRMAYARTNNKTDAEDITQETFFKAMKSIGAFKGECDIRVWLCQIAKNTYYTYCKKQKRFVPAEEVEEEIQERPVSIERRFEDKEQALNIHKVLHALEEPYKEVFQLRVFGELSFRDIGEIFGKTESWSRVTFYRAKNKLVKKMEES